MLEDTELKYSQLELVFSKNIMDCLMSLDPPIHDDYLYFIGLTKNNDRAKEIMIKETRISFGVFIH